MRDTTFTHICVFNIEECDRGSYGADCNGTCGHCRDIKQCSNVNGTCVNGCGDGYKGNLCKTREYTYHNVYATVTIYITSESIAVTRANHFKLI